MSFRFELLRPGDPEAEVARTGPRRGRLHTPRGTVETPVFLPVATRGMLRGIAPDRLGPLGAQMLLANAFHLHARPGVEVVEALGGVHGMLAWSGPVLTDSGGFQVFSLNALAGVRPDGVEVEHPVYGGRLLWTPEAAFTTQARLGPDVAMVLDVCPDRADRRTTVEPAVALTLRWAREQRRLHDARGGAASGQALFGIVQGGVFPDLREGCARALVDLDFDGYAVGGVSIGEDHGAMMQAVAATTPFLPGDRPRYLMGVGTPRDLVESVARGIDLFDCVFPARAGRFATALTWQGRLHLLNARHRTDAAPIEPGCPCAACRSGVPRGALRAGFKARELLPPILVSLHNLHFTLELMRRIRRSLETGGFAELRAAVGRAYPPRPPAPPAPAARGRGRR